MKVVGIRDIVALKTKNEKLNETYKNLSLAVSMASGYVWKEKVNSFSKIIAKELLTFLEEEPIKINYYAFTNEYYRIHTHDNSICFHKNNLFQTANSLSKEQFLNQKLLYLEQYDLPPFLTNTEKELITQKITKEESMILNTHYNRQELNGNRYFLINNIKGKEQLISILARAHYFCMTVKEYLVFMESGNEKLDLQNIKGEQAFQTTYNNYILELGAYIARQIKERIKTNDTP